MNELILATSNPHKIIELEAILSPIKCMTQNTLGIIGAEETGLSFVENAIIKARHASRLAQTPALADDSGIVVEALKGNPGIYSARFAGLDATDEDNVLKLLQHMQNIPQDKRKAYYYCAIVVVLHENDPTPLIATGKLQGYISTSPKGTQGFGYDPILYLPQHECTVAELLPTIKNKISHRALALKQLQQQWFDK